MKIISNDQKYAHKVVLLNYTNSEFRSSQKTNRKTVKSIGSFGEIRSYNPNDIDSNFRKLNEKKLKIKRGNGYWLWKPFFY